ncbi:MAG TPA: alpha/beta fold hydrolase, partial [Actinomycetota bacterium]|nr:alpha/beta fold hydrolase [Actinomycetota bacterium]
MRAAVTFDLGDAGAWGLMLDSGRAAITKSPPRDPDLYLRTSPTVMQEILLGRRPGYEAFLAGELEARGNIALGLELESLFDPPTERDPSYPVTIHPKIGRVRWSVLAAGPPEGLPVLLIHGLASSKMSFLPTVKGLSGTYRVYAVDLPGFGDSAKPMAPYDAPWFADRVLELLDELELKQAGLVGNSMGGRISLEVAAREPDRVKAMVLLCPALGIPWFRQAVPFVRLARAEFAALPLAPSRGRVMRTLRS